MNFVISKEDFINLKKIVELNKKFFSTTKDYVPKIKRAEAKAFQKPVWDKMRELKNDLLENVYFDKRFDIIVSRPHKQSTKTVKGLIRRLVWVSLANNSELIKKGNEKFKHVHIPQLQVSFQPDRLIVASIWLEGDNCKQVYREIFLKYLKVNGVDNKYTLMVYNKDDDKKEFEDLFGRLNSKDYDKFLNSPRYSLGLCRILKPEEVIHQKVNLFSLIVSELQYLNENILMPCFNFTQKNKAILNIQSPKTKRKARSKFDIKDSLRKGTEPTIVTKKHQEIQNALFDLFTVQIKGTPKYISIERDFVDIQIEDPSDKSMILYEIKTDKTALNCIKHGLGQLLFYNLINKNLGLKNIELVIVGLHRLKPKEKEFVRSIKEYLGKNVFRYQRFDEKKKKLLDEKMS